MYYLLFSMIIFVLNNKFVITEDLDDPVRLVNQFIVFQN